MYNPFEIEGAEAFSATLKNKSRKFPDRQDARSRNGLLFPDVQPSFTLTERDVVFTIGSCFARNVERVLLERSISVPTAHFSAPQEEAPGQPNRILNQYNPGTMLQCVQDARTEVHGRGLYRLDDEHSLDCLLATGSRPVRTKRAEERRREVRDLYRSGLERANIVILTLGLIEAWYDRDDEVYLNEAPPRKLLNDFPRRFVFRQLGIRECDELVSELMESLLNGGRRKVLLTVSPVPLQVTFAGGDAVSRNAYSKAVLRAVAENVSRAHPDVDYFPSYEIVTSGGLRNFGEDQVHVRDIVVRQVVDYLMERYLPSQLSR